MTGPEEGIDAWTRALLAQGFHATHGFEVFVTFVRDNDPLKIYAGPNGAFAACDGDGKLIMQGEGLEDLNRALVVTTAVRAAGCKDFQGVLGVHAGERR